MERKEWFAEWFNSKYYHILYKDRNYIEAEQFLSKLIDFLKPNPTCKMIDLACGKGRHSIFLNKLGFDVTGVDLSENSILFAKTFENNNLHFEVADLRSLSFDNSFDIGLNLFTSFGYFESDEVNKTVFIQFNKILKTNGILVVDFFNASKIYQQTNCVESKKIENVTFNICKSIENKRVNKTIEFIDDDKHYYFTESVQLINKDDFIYLIEATNFKLLYTFGNYNLDEYNEQTSDRLIMIAQKL